MKLLAPHKLRPKALAQAIKEALGPEWDVSAKTTGNPKDARIAVRGRIADGRPVSFSIRIADHPTPESAADAVIEALGKHGAIMEVKDDE